MPKPYAFDKQHMHHFCSTILLQATELEAISLCMERNHRKKASENCTKQQINRLELDKKKRDAESEIDQLLSQLNLTVSDIHSLQNEVKLIRSMGKNSHDGCSIKCGVEKASLVQAADAELEAAKKELLSFKEEGFKLMDDMDAIREEIRHVAKEKQRSSSISKRLESIVEQLNYELRSSKSKLEVASSAQKRASDIVSDLPADLRRLQADRDAAERDAESTHEAIGASRSELMKTESSVLYVEERLQAAMEEMKAAITFEAIAEQKVRAIADCNSSNRANSSLYGSSTVTISKFQHYLIEQAKAAQEIAGQKVEAAQAWIEALATGKDGDHSTQRRRLSTSSRKPFVPKKTIKTKLSVHDADKKQVQSLDSKLAPATRRRSFTLSRVPDQSRRVKLRRSAGSSKAQPAVVSADTCLAVGRKKIILKLIKFLGGSVTGKCIHYVSLVGEPPVVIQSAHASPSFLSLCLLLARSGSRSVANGESIKMPPGHATSPSSALTLRKESQSCRGRRRIKCLEK
ncbi:hypothetical protein ZIOFF_064388 [Zingiber officinale]|uniref:Uncharacterized protein n=1 Tax=Zingiber officinale TaxID=94328 RepID=A0A8J5K893_ZINOF|nr:hypothetical protein ZIOFF_064388 [Zingiber officinale]